MADKIYGFRDLIVWQKAMQLVDVVYGLMRGFPQDERFRLCDQLGRAVVSIPSNIAEGNGRSSARDYAHFLEIARGSLYETMTQLEIAVRQKYIADLSSVNELSGEVAKMLNTLISRLAKS